MIKFVSCNEQLGKPKFKKSGGHFRSNCECTSKQLAIITSFITYITVEMLQMNTTKNDKSLAQ